LIPKNQEKIFSKYFWPNTMPDNELNALLMKDLDGRIDTLNKKMKVKITQNQFDALLSMMFNCGAGNGSFLKAVQLANQGKFKEAADQIESGPTMSKGKVLAGLVRRRKEEAERFRTPDGNSA